MGVKDKHATHCNVLLERLFSASDAAAQMDALRAIKNAAIGNRAKKHAFAQSEQLADLLGRVLAADDAAAPAPLKETAAIVVGTLAGASPRLRASEQIRRALEAAVVASSASSSASSSGAASSNVAHAGLVAAALRALRDYAAAVAVTPALAAALVALLAVDAPSNANANANANNANANALATHAAALATALAAAAAAPNQALLADAGALAALLACAAAASATTRLHDAALDALAALVRANAAAAQRLVALFAGPERSVALLLRLLNEARQPMTRLLAAQCLSNLYKVVALDNQRFPELLLLPTLIQLFAESAVAKPDNLALLERAPRVFSDLVEDSESLQKLALDGGAIAKLAELLLSPQVRSSVYGGAALVTSGGDGMIQDLDSDAAVAAGKASKLLGGGGGSGSKTGIVGGGSGIDADNSDAISGSKTYETVAESCLLAISSVCSLREDCRKQVIDAKLLPLIVTALSNPSTKLRSAACKCTRSLSRSVKNLRTSLVDAGIASPLFILLNDPNIQVQTSASATLCNIVLDFSPMKKTVIENGGVEQIVKLVASDDYQLKLNSVWALKNLLYQAGSDIKSRVMEELGWDVLKRLIHDPRVGIQEQSLNLLRNLVCGKEDDIDTAFSGFGEAALSVLFDKKLSNHTRVSSDYDGVILQTLYIIVNIATGNERHKGLIVGSDLIMGNVLKLMNHEKSLIRLATVWCVLNLTEPDDSHPKFSQERLIRLKAFGFLEQLKNMLLDSDPDVRDRVKTALKNLGVSSDSSSSTRLHVTNDASGGLDLMDIDDGAGGPAGIQMEGMQDLSAYLSGRSG
ncbi:armadillo-type protein [Obelidium mucronatum]|nr:armadillo-type protein [Obelidium mucronatum]